MILRITAESSTIRIFSLRNLRSWWRVSGCRFNATAYREFISYGAGGTPAYRQADRRE
jgi:hypothetical protein